MGAFAGMAVSVKETSVRRDRKLEMLYEFWILQFLWHRSSSYILRNTRVMQASKNNLSECNIDQEKGFRAGLPMSSCVEMSNSHCPEIRDKKRIYQHCVN